MNRTNTRRPQLFVQPGSQRGVALVMAMVILIILTLIGISAMNTSLLQGKMSGNTQESTRAFEAAESALSKAMNDAGALDIHAVTTKTYTIGGADASVMTEFLAFAPPKRGSGYSAINYNAANFDQESKGSTTTNAQSEVHQGIAQIVNKSE